MYHEFHKKFMVLGAEKLANHMPVSLNQVGLCEICGRKTELEKVKGYNFKMCPHCAYMTAVHAVEDHDSYHLAQNWGIR
jgi:predicted amidophosphoribosyltransferase